MCFSAAAVAAAAVFRLPCCKPSVALQPVGLTFLSFILPSCSFPAAAAMAKVKQTARKSVGGQAPPRRRAGRKSATASAHIQVWHPALTTAAEQGEELLDEALEAEVEADGELLYETSGEACCPHSGSRRPSGRRVGEVPQSPFPPRSSFGIVPYAVWHGHYDVVEAYIGEMDADVERTAQVSRLGWLEVPAGWDVCVAMPSWLLVLAWQCPWLPSAMSAALGTSAAGMELQCAGPMRAHGCAGASGATPASAGAVGPERAREHD